MILSEWVHMQLDSTVPFLLGLHLGFEYSLTPQSICVLAMTDGDQ